MERADSTGRKAAPAGDPWDEASRQETPAQRADRNLGEILQELRVLSVGVQVLFGFLLSFPLNARFTRLSPGQRALYTLSLCAAGLATVLLVAPVAYHRLVFGHHEKARLVRMASRMALAGIGAVGTAITTAFWLVISVVYGGDVAAVFGAGTVVIIVVLWVVIPVRGRRLGR